MVHQVPSYSSQGNQLGKRSHWLKQVVVVCVKEHSIKLEPGRHHLRIKAIVIRFEEHFSLEHQTMRMLHHYQKLALKMVEQV